MPANRLVPVGYRFFKALIATSAAVMGLDPLLVAAICWQESAFQTDAFRFEPMFWNRYLKGNPKYAHLNPRRVSSSYGLMQVMYCRLLEDRISANDAWAPEDMFEHEKGLAVGCAFLAELLAWGKTTSPDDSSKALLAGLAAYNGGRGGNDPRKNWPLRNAKYASEVLHKLSLLKGV